MMLKRYPALAAIILSLFLAGCVPPAPPIEEWVVPVEKESRWSADYAENEETLPLTLVLLPAEKTGGPARLAALSAFGSVLGDCLLTEGRWDGQWGCRGPRGTKKLMNRLTEVVSEMLKAGAPEIFEYRPTGSSDWSVRLKRLAVKQCPES